MAALEFNFSLSGGRVATGQIYQHQGSFANMYRAEESILAELGKCGFECVEDPAHVEGKRSHMVKKDGQPLATLSVEGRVSPENREPKPVLTLDGTSQQMEIITGIVEKAATEFGWKRITPLRSME